MVVDADTPGAPKRSLSMAQRTDDADDGTSSTRKKLMFAARFANDDDDGSADNSATALEADTSKRVKVAAEVVAVEAASPSWYWKSSPSSWTAYTAAESAVIEGARATQKTTIVLDSGYTVDLAALRQFKPNAP